MADEIKPKTDEPVVPPVTEVPKPDDKEPSWLAGRLERERKALLKDLGVEDVKDVKVALADYKKIKDSEKTELEKYKAENEELKKSTARMTEVEETLKSQSESLLSTITPEQKEALIKVVGSDPAKLIAAITNFKTAKFFDSKSVEPKPKTPPVTSGAAPHVPGSVAPGQVDHLSTYDQLKTTNPYLASLYLNKYSEQIVAAKKKT